MRKIFLFIVISLAFIFSVEAKYRRNCIAQYMTESGWSKRYQVEVTFMTGYELNSATNSYRYKTNSVYAIIFWGEGQATVIRLTNYMFCGFEVDKNCIMNTFGDLKGLDQDGDEWKICKDDYCF